MPPMPSMSHSLKEVVLFDFSPTGVIIDHFVAFLQAHRESVWLLGKG